MEILKSSLALRSYWQDQADQTLLPEGNLDRDEFLKVLDDLEGSNLITCLMGQRRCGKSVVARQFIRRLWDRGIPRRNILYINFFLRPLRAMCHAETFQEMMTWWVDEVVDSGQRSYLILDEVHLLEHWDDLVASMFEDPKFRCRILITGSNSALLSEDLSAKLGGRFTVLQVFPFSWTEYCRFLQKPLTLSSIEAYLTDGGLPEVVKMTNLDQRAQLILDIINSIVKNDIIRRYNPSNPLLLTALIDYVSLAYAQEVSVKNLQGELSANLATMIPQKNPMRSSTLIETYLKYMSDVYFVYCPETYSYRLKDVLNQSVGKIYLSDLGFAQTDMTASKGRLLENMIFLEIIKRGFVIRRFFGYRNRNVEIDFWIKKGAREALIQVCWTLGSADENPEMWEREFGSLSSIRKNAAKIVVSMDPKIGSPDPSILHMNVISFLDWLDREDVASHVVSPV